MTMFKNYLWYRIRKTWLMTSLISLVGVLLTAYVVYDEVTRLYSSGYSGETGIYMLAVVMGIAATVIPFLELMDFKSRRNLDTLYFLPLSRFKMALAHYIGGFARVMVIYTSSFAASLPFILSYAKYYKLQYLPLYYLLSLVAGLVIYSFFMFIFSQANSSVDGVIFSVLWMFLPTLLIAFAADAAQPMLRLSEWEMKDNLYNGNFLHWGITYIPINNLTMIFQNMIESRSGAFALSVAEIYEEWYMFAVWGVAAVACTYGYFRTFIKKGAEQAGEIADSWFGYKILIPCYGYTIMLRMNSMPVELILWALLVVSYIIYRRSARLKHTDIIHIVLMLILSL